MINDKNHKWFTAKDIKEILGITPGQLFHWGRTWGVIKPDIKAQGRQGKDKYSFQGLLILALIKELLDVGLELKAIKEMMNSPLKTKGESWKKEDFYDIFSHIKERKKDIIYYLVILSGLKEKSIQKTYWTIQGFVKGHLPFSSHPKFKTVLTLNLSFIINEMEEKTGLKL